MAIVTATYDTDKSDVSFGKKKHQVPLFQCMSKGDRMTKDARELLKELTQTESWLFWTMDQKKDPKTNITSYSRKDLPDDKKNTYARTIKNLISKNMLVRVKQDTYLINPILSYPGFEYMKDVQFEWIKHGGKV